MLHQSRASSSFFSLFLVTLKGKGREEKKRGRRKRLVPRPPVPSSSCNHHSVSLALQARHDRRLCRPLLGATPGLSRAQGIRSLLSHCRPDFILSLGLLLAPIVLSQALHAVQLKIIASTQAQKGCKAHKGRQGCKEAQGQSSPQGHRALPSHPSLLPHSDLLIPKSPGLELLARQLRLCLHTRPFLPRTQKLPHCRPRYQ